jgi:hypothetical protein
LNSFIDGFSIKIFISAFDTILRMNESLDDDQTMIAPEKMGEMLLAWTDPQWGLEYVVSFFLPACLLIAILFWLGLNT